MAKEQSDYDRLQECSQLISSLIELEKLYREQMVSVDDRVLTLPDDMVDDFKAKFRSIRVEVIVSLNQIHP